MYLFRLLLFVGILLLSTQHLMAQTLVSGVVKDDLGNGISSVKIYNEQDELISETDDEGYFRAVVNENMTRSLSFEHPEFKTVHRSLPAPDENFTIMLLRHDPTRMVSLAYGQQTFEELTTSVSSISGDEMLKTPAANLSNTLYGRLPGLTVIQNSGGEPGYDAPSMMIRGTSTYRDAGFLVFVDGVESSYDQLAVEEIESLTVLKDAASLALFGIRGANGAIWVTTKRGYEGPTQISFSGRTGFQQPIQVPTFLDSYNYARLYNEALQNDGLQPEYTQDELDMYQSGSLPFMYPNVNWYDEVLRESTPMSNYGLTFRGGSDTFQYFLLLGMMQQNGLYANTSKDQEENSNANFNRYNFRSNIDVNISEAVQASLDLAGRIENRIFPAFNGPQLWNNMAIYPPNAYPVKNPDNTWGGNSIYPDNPVASVLARGFHSTYDNNLNATFRLSQDLGEFVPGLSFSQALAFQNWFRGSYNKERDYASYEITGHPDDTTYTYSQQSLETDYTVTQGGNNQWRRSSLQLALNYENPSDGPHGFSGLLLYKQNLYVTSGNNVPYGYQNLAGRLRYSYDSRYFAEFGFSYSGSENFAEGNRFGFFPAFSAGWLISNEAFMAGNSVVNFLKLRGSVGLLGNDNLGTTSRFPYIQDYYYSSGGYYFGSGNTLWGTIQEGALANQQITWEKGLKTNVGIDATLFNSLNITFDYFFEKRFDILANGSNSVPAVIGAILPAENIGEVHNQGFELDIMLHDNIGGFSYFVAPMVSYSLNEVKYMNEVPRAESYLYRTGHSIGQPFGLEALGFFDSWDEIESSPRQTFGPVQPGDIRYKDQNGDDIIDINDEGVIGKPSSPNITYALNIGAAYKGFDFELFFQGVGERDVYLNGPLFWAFVNDAKVAPNALNRWTPDNKENATYPRLTASPNENNYRPSDFWMKSGDFLRLRNIELGYTLPQNLLDQWIGISSARIYVSGINVLSWDSFERVDPETMAGYPVMRSYNVGFKMKF